MKPKTLILMVVAVACGLMASYMTSKLLAERGDKPAEDMEMVKILVAKKNLALGTLIKVPEDFFEEKEYVKGKEPKKAISNFAELKDHRLNKSINQEQWIGKDDLMDKNQDGLGAVMAKGMRALGIKVNSDAVAGGFVLPNSRVDIVWVKRGNDGDASAKTILQNVLVLAVGTIAQRPDDKQALMESTVTVAVSPEQAEKLSLAVEMGSLKLILRPFGDEDTVKTQGASPKGIGKGGDAEANGNGDEKEDTTVRSPWRGLDKIPDVKVPTPAATSPTTVADAAKTLDKEPERKVHLMTIINGERVRRVPFPLDENGKPIVDPVEKNQPDQDKASK